MTTAPRHYCAAPGCTTLVDRGYCPRHRPSYGRAGRSIYSTRRWRLLRRRILADNPWCQHTGCTARATDVDHIVDLQDGGAPWSPANLQALCHPHHSTKTAASIRRRSYGRPQGGGGA